MISSTCVPPPLVTGLGQGYPSPGCAATPGPCCGHGVDVGSGMGGSAGGDRPGHVRMDLTQERVAPGGQGGDGVDLLTLVDDLALEHDRPGRVLDGDVVRDVLLIVEDEGEGLVGRGRDL